MEALYQLEYQQAFNTLAKLSNRGATEHLMAVLDNPNPAIRRTAVILLGTLGDERAADALIEALKDVSIEVRQEAIKALSWLYDEKAIEPIMCALMEDNMFGNERTDEVCMIMNNNVKTFNDFYADENSIAGFEAAGAKVIDSQMETAINALQDRDAQVRIRATRILGGSRDKRAVEPLVRSLRDKDEDVCANAAAALGRLGFAEAVKPLIQALKADYSLVRCNAAKALGMLGDKKAVEPLIKALEDKHCAVRWEAITALGKLSDKRAIAPLTKAFNEEEIKPVSQLRKNRMRQNISQALTQIKDVEALVALAIIQQSYLPHGHSLDYQYV